MSRANRAIEAFYAEHAARYREIEERQWQVEYDAAPVDQKCLMLSLRKYRESVAAWLPIELSARTLRIPIMIR